MLHEALLHDCHPLGFWVSFCFMTELYILIVEEFGFSLSSWYIVEKITS
jgi:hypothetical protein